MDSEDRFNQLITQLGSLNEQVRQLEDVDYMTATYKGYSNTGLTLEEVKDEIDRLHQQIKTLNRELDAFD
ncbi:hypothetical protein [Lentilactobacillus hilgardii]|uniref:Uncharacterized protein n=1 Tax=Lentilactobacillus hilgardii (strain ATCC 8290 / DSM 20176 / CCUG 30140 / JCM 1155 / KCTC 3500 / NBRC 15886 / NCIMB 8040 / NRRL B-1843 / 9) TaxID=1423757 RepID=C0XMY4_LENH9|nr:hypothetical protein [Lentilactobacillus hilgardii]EEI23269.1 hypothetical protein HMPREF0519_2595 [Lentilactobacillus hilgardii DSM 20176 = ATCC 8290]KRK52751.1 hypothetical protein FD42_GL002304 [Lentilactobacillus hilgardii DSM 20176 = ATCC 8290]MCP9333103.1 hypothetical protein [Lentilactobacillus hilgardii]MCP9349712.1 hypothetical protein [Lentilactobacillus hilgardii]MCP9352648.1 hypothetical protein [Lentilactobacillus hilgardii]